MPFIVSTLANSQRITDFARPTAEGQKIARPATAKRQIVIKGGAGVQGALRTPNGVLTAVTEDDVAFLKTVPLFQRLEKRGYFKIVNREPAPDKVAKDLVADVGEIVDGQRISSGSAQLSIENGDFEEGGRASGIAPTEDEPTI